MMTILTMDLLQWMMICCSNEKKGERTIMISIDYNVIFCDTWKYVPCKDGIPIYESTKCIIVDTYNLNGLFNMSIEITEDFFEWKFINHSAIFSNGIANSYKFDVSKYDIKGVRIKYTNKRVKREMTPRNKVRVEIEKK
jgi:hypothetical protein